MKSLLWLGMFAAATASAAEVRITRFVPATPDGRIADLCGKVGQDISRTVRVISDYDTPTRSVYIVQTDVNGEFCHLVATRYGRVLVVADDVEIFSGFTH